MNDGKDENRVRNLLVEPDVLIQWHEPRQRRPENSDQVSEDWASRGSDQLACDGVGKTPPNEGKHTHEGELRAIHPLPKLVQPLDSPKLRT